MEPDVQSPCIRQCCLDDDDICMGCFRTIEDIAFWNEANSSQRKLIVENAQQRGNIYRLKHSG